MANPKNLEYPFGWRGLSGVIPSALAGPYTRAMAETPAKQRYDFIGAPVYRADAATRMLLLVPNIRRVSRMPMSMARGDIKESSRG